MAEALIKSMYFVSLRVFCCVLQGFNCESDFVLSSVAVLTRLVARRQCNLAQCGTTLCCLSWYATQATFQSAIGPLPLPTNGRHSTHLLSEHRALYSDAAAGDRMKKDICRGTLWVSNDVRGEMCDGVGTFSSVA